MYVSKDSMGLMKKFWTETKQEVTEKFWFGYRIIFIYI